MLSAQKVASAPNMWTCFWGDVAEDLTRFPTTLGEKVYSGVMDREEDNRSDASGDYPDGVLPDEAPDFWEFVLCPDFEGDPVRRQLLHSELLGWLPIDSRVSFFQLDREINFPTPDAAFYLFATEDKAAASSLAERLCRTNSLKDVRRLCAVVSMEVESRNVRSEMLLFSDRYGVRAHLYQDYTRDDEEYDNLMGK